MIGELHAYCIQGRDGARHDYVDDHKINFTSECVHK